MNMNKMMRERYEFITRPELPLPEALARIVDSGFYEVDGCNFLKSLWRDNYNFYKEIHWDRTGYECFVNEIHIDEYIKSDNLYHGIHMIQIIFNEWKKVSNHLILIAVLSLDNDFATIKIHTKRDNERWLESDLEGYSQEILTVDSSEDGIVPC